MGNKFKDLQTQTSMATPETVSATLQAALGKMGRFQQCALLNYPNYINLGDHLIWLGNLFYLRQILKAQVGYTASSAEFLPDAMEARVGKVPILLSGGGSFGDLWYSHQRFRESIVSRYTDRPIIILPQTIYFQDPAKLAQAATIFNNHPDLTIFARDRISYNLAKDAFHSCNVWMAPDAAFQLTALAQFPTPEPRQRILYHCRTDPELLAKLPLKTLPLPLDIADWRPYEDGWIMGSHNSPLKQVLATAIREGWQRGIARPRESCSNHRWNTDFRPDFLLKGIYPNHRQRLSWSFVHSAIYQFRRYRLIITNRLHGHILATLLRIPHVFLPNSYHKNQAFYETWTAGIPYCRFATEPDQVQVAAESLLADSTT